MLLFEFNGLNKLPSAEAKTRYLVSHHFAKTSKPGFVPFGIEWGVPFMSTTTTFIYATP
jgi:hypothetical protein